jgi:type I restriction enzyme S subunit
MQSEDVQDQLRARASGTTVLGIKQSELRKVLLTLPPIDEQRAIAHILGTLDDKIELNRRMNETLEAIARALFKSWFVDFDPVYAKAESRNPGLPKPLADLFPDSFEDSELGEIPKGWAVANMNDVADINYGQNLPQSELLEHGIPVYGAAGVIGHYSEAMFSEPIVLVTSRGSGSGTVHETWGPAFVTNNSFSVVPKHKWFSRHYLKEALLRGDISSLVTGSAQPQLTISSFNHLKLVRPTEQIVQEFHRASDSLWQKKNTNEQQSRTLAALRDTLLPKLISGELRVKDAERVVERHT